MLAPEIEIEIGGRVRKMRPTFKNIMAIERELNVTSMTLIGRVMQADIGATIMLSVIYNGLNGSPDRMERDAIEAELETNGLKKYIKYVTEFFTAHLSGQPEKKPEPVQSEPAKTLGGESLVTA